MCIRFVAVIRSKQASFAVASVKKQLKYFPLLQKRTLQLAKKTFHFMLILYCLLYVFFVHDINNFPNSFL